jgi:hypothetical protein
MLNMDRWFDDHKFPEGLNYEARLLLKQSVALHTLANIEVRQCAENRRQKMRITKMLALSAALGVTGR